MTNSADPDQFASEEANWSGSTLFAQTRHVMLSKRRVKVTVRTGVDDFLILFLFYLFFFFLIFCKKKKKQIKIGLDISYESFGRQTIHMKCQILFSQKNISPVSGKRMSTILVNRLDDSFWWKNEYNTGKPLRMPKPVQ